MIALKCKPKMLLEQVSYDSASFCSLAHTLSHVSLYYPNFKEWLYFTFRKEMISGTRSIVVAHDQGRVAGLALLKNSSAEKKICTFYVLPSFREIGLGHQLMDASIACLGNKDTTITVAEERNSELYPLLKSKGFSLEKKITGLYRDNVDEYFYSLK